MKFQTTPTLCTLTLSRAEIAALTGIASKDAARVNLSGFLIEPASRVAVATDGHRMLVAVAGAAAGDDPNLGIGREIVVSREDAAVWIKACGSKESIRISWAEKKNDGGRQEVTATVVDAVEREGAKFTAFTTGASFPPWRAVCPDRPNELAAVVAVNAAYLAEACTLLGKVSGNKQPAIHLWGPAAPSERAIKDAKANGGPVGSLDPMLLTMDTIGDDAIGVSWRYVLMPMRADIGSPWKVPAKPEKKKTAEDLEDERAAAE